MPIPPSQKGKFKPRKPPKKIKPGSSTSAASSSAAAPDAPTSTPTVAFAPSTFVGRGGRGGRDGGRGKGRGGGKGRGRGRTPVPSGTVFFTGSEKKESATAKKRAPSSTTRKRNKNTETTEEIVGQLDTAIGTKKTKEEGEGTKTSILDRMDYEDQDGEQVEEWT